MKNPIKSIKQYIEEVAVEAKKVSWPTRKQTFNLTLIVIGASMAISIFMTIIDYLLEKITLGF